jgi:hypothetical protein
MSTVVGQQRAAVDAGAAIGLDLLMVDWHRHGCGGR